ncbi:MAG: hypothetical protein HOO91_08135 [Bacteroidales bacterium]|nr:hypothetical protein [Bacteroidales bacterium]
MKKLIISLALLAITSTAICQTKQNIQACIKGYNLTDTIQIDDLIRIGELSLNTKEYSIVGFGLVFMGGVFLTEFKSNSNKLTDEMRSALTGLKGKNMRVIKICFENITIVTPSDNRRNIGALIYRLKIK